MQKIAFSEFEKSRSPALPEAPETILPTPVDNSATALSPRITARETLDFQLRGHHGNKLLEAAMPMLGLSVRIRSMSSFGDIEALHARLVNEIQTFQRELEMLDYDSATVIATRYALCAMLDEAVLSQIWGAESQWTERPLLSVFHNETWGGEKFFSILDRVMNESHRFINLLEFLYFCLVLGFEGKYHVIHNGQAKLDYLIDSAYKLLEKHRGEAPVRLVDPDRHIYDKQQTMPWRLPIWGIAALTLVTLIGIHLAFDITLDRRIEEIGSQIRQSLDITPPADLQSGGLQ